MTCPVCKGNPRGVSAGYCKQIGRVRWLPCEACDYDGNEITACERCKGDPDHYEALWGEPCPECKGTGKREDER